MGDILETIVRMLGGSAAVAVAVRLAFWRVFPSREKIEAAKLEALERAEAAADRAVFSADPGFAAELGYQPAPYPKPDRYQKPQDARSAAFAAAMQNQHLSAAFAAAMQNQAQMQAQMQGYQHMQQLRALGIGNAIHGQLSRQQAGMLGNALGGGLGGQALGGLGNAGAGLFGSGFQQVTLRQTGRFTMAPMTPLQEAPKDPNIGAALDGLISLYCAETIPCTCGAPETRDPTFHHGYCAIWQRKA
ncbi:MAG: hypothetical protein M0R28_20995 [Pigmentiphaga sp.]|nr:hypothetical protein [Pigmentiphaga sp.]